VAVSEFQLPAPPRQVSWVVRLPPGGTPKSKDARWSDDDDLDEAQMTTWVKQAAALPGWVP
jgi:hypothetical protein